jgi:hypothetical protein
MQTPRDRDARAKLQQVSAEATLSDNAVHLAGHALKQKKLTINHLVVLVTNCLPLTNQPARTSLSATRQQKPR